MSDSALIAILNHKPYGHAKSEREQHSRLGKSRESEHARFSQIK